MGAPYESSAVRTVTDLVRTFLRPCHLRFVDGGVRRRIEHIRTCRMTPCTSAMNIPASNARLSSRCSNRRRGAVARLSNLYGSGMSSRNVISTILGQIPGPGPLVVMHTIPVRDFLWVDDAAEGSPSSPPRRRRRASSISRPALGRRLASVARLALEIAGESGREVVATRQRPCVHDRGRSPGACAREYGWQARVGLRDGLAFLLSTSPVPR